MLKVFNIIGLCIVLFLMFVVSFLDKKLPLNDKKKVLLTFVLIISVICGFKVIGLDTEPYRNIFNETPITPINFDFLTHMFSGRLEPAFVVLISLIKRAELGFKTFLFISAIVPMYIIYRVIIKKEKNIPLFTFFFFLLLWLFRGPLDTIRHFFAAAIYLSAIYSLSHDKKLKFYFKSFLSVLFHYSAVAIFLIRPFLKIKWSVKGYVFTMLILSLFALFGKGVIINLVSEINTTNPILWKLQYYLLYGNDRYTYQNTLHEVMWYLMTYSIVFFNIIINIVAIYNRRIIDKDRFYSLLLNSQIIGTVLVVILSSINASTLGLRLNFLFSIGNFFLVKELIFNVMKTKREIGFMLTVLSFVVYNFIIILYFAGIFDPNSPFGLV